MNVRHASVFASLGFLAVCAPGDANADVLALVDFPGNCSIPAPVQMFQFTGTGPLAEVAPISSTSLSSPTYVVFSPTRELYVSNCNGSAINRFVVDAAGAAVPAGTLNDSHLANAHGIAQSQWGELFAANFDSGVIVRFTFSGSVGTFNGTITTGGTQLQGLAFSPRQELFATTYTGVYRFTFGPAPTYAATANGTFTIPGSGRLHGIAFSSWGELFVADSDRNVIYRYTFDTTGAPVMGASIPLSAPAAGTIGVTLSNAGELFAAGQSGSLSRFTFDSHCGAVPSGQTTYPALAGVDAYPRAIDSIAHPVVHGCTTEVADAGGVLDASADAGAMSDVVDVPADVTRVVDAGIDAVARLDSGTGNPMSAGCGCRIDSNDRGARAWLPWSTVVALAVLGSRRRRPPSNGRVV